MQSTLIQFAAIAALALCTVIAIKAQADGDLFFSKPDAAGRCKASHAVDDRRCLPARVDCRQRAGIHACTRPAVAASRRSSTGRVSSRRPATR